MQISNWSVFGPMGQQLEELGIRKMQIIQCKMVSGQNRGRPSASVPVASGLPDMTRPANQ